MEKFQSQNIRNVVLLAHAGAGKTSLSEAMLFNAGVINRLGRVDEGTTTSDYDPDETKRKISINLSLLPLPWQGHKINLIDTPGYSDFVGEVKAGVRVADGAMLVVCCSSGIEVGTELAWGYAEEATLPLLILINKIDRENADFYKVVDQIQARFGTKCVPIQLPIGAQDKFEGIVDLVQMKSVRDTNAGDIPADLKERAGAFRTRLIEAVAETDDALIEKYLDGQELTDEEISRGLKRGILERKIVPVLVSSGLKNTSIKPVLNAICAYLPSPRDRGAVTATNPATQAQQTLEPDEAAPLAALVFKTTADPYVGKLTYFRTYAGKLSSDSNIWNGSKGKPERVGQLFTIRGKSQEPAPEIPAGDIGGVAKLSETAAGDTLCQKEHPVVLAPIEFPKPVYSVAVYPKTKADTDKLGQSLARAVEEDPTLQVRKDPDTGEIVLSGMGNSQVEVTAEKIRRKFGVNVNLETPKVPYKEAITTTVTSEYKHKKQTGGHGQYGHVFLRLEPLPKGSGVQFDTAVVGGSVPRNFYPAVEKGVMETVAEGVIAGFPVVDVKVTLYDGSFHAVDSSEMSFKLAAIHAFKKGVTQAQPVLLEPIVNMKITAPDTFTGDIIGDLNSKRARVQGMIPQDGMNVIEAQAPLAEVLSYAIDLRSITQGRGTFTMEFSHYEQVPAHLTQKIVEAKKEVATA